MATRRKGLGRGLDALMGAGTRQQEPAVSVQDAIEQDLQNMQKEGNELLTLLE